MKKRLMACGRGVLFVAIAAALFLGASHVFSPKNNQKEFGMADPAAHGVLGERKDSIDAVFLGDSEASTTFSPLQIWEEQGFTSYTCATNGQKLCYTRTLLQQALREQCPRVVVLETNAIYTSLTPSDALAQAASDALPVFQYHDRWKSLRLDDVTRPITCTWTDDFKGSYANGQVNAANAARHMAPTDNVATIPSLNALYLQDIAHYCESHGAKLILVSTPSTVNWNQARHNGIAKFAEEQGVTYLDLNVAPIKLDIDWNVDTRDKGDHLNVHGAAKVSSFIGSYLKEVFTLSDHRKDTDYAAWNESLARHKKHLAEI